MPCTDGTIAMEALNRVFASKDKWVALPAASKLKYIDEIRSELYTHFYAYSAAAVDKRLSQLYGEDKKPSAIEQEFVSLSCTVLSTLVLANWLFHLRKIYASIDADTGLPKSSFSDAPNSTETIVKVGPFGVLESLALPFGSIQLILNDNATKKLVTNRPSSVSVILGAGNYDAPVDMLHSLFILNSVCVFKLSPISSGFYGIYKAIFKPLIDDGFVEIIVDDEARGVPLIEDDKVDRVVMTGSVDTANILLWGSPTPPLKSSGEDTLLKKEYLFECGNCTPWIVCPGKWSHKELVIHAKHIVFAMLLNAGHVCVHPQLIVTCKNWPQRAQFNDLIIKYLKQAPVLCWFYPNFKEKMQFVKDSLTQEYDNMDDFAFPINYSLGQQELFYATNMRSAFFSKYEAFCSAAGEISLDTADSIPEFLSSAVDYVNTECYGNLSCAISVKEQTEADRKAVERAMHSLNYGSITINVFPAYGFIFPEAVWGAFPEFDEFNMQSGCGFLGNCYGFESVKKAVIRAPFVNSLIQSLAIPNPLLGRVDKVLKQFTLLLCEQSVFKSTYRLLRLTFGALFNL